MEMVEISGWPGVRTTNALFALYRDIFGQVDETKFFSRMLETPSLFTLVARDGDTIAGFKCGFPIDDGIFYSWIGGVREAYRRKGIARSLMQRQHAWCLENGYRSIRTKTYNRWKSMLILNLESGFDISGTVQKEDGRLQILLEKQLIGG